MSAHDCSSSWVLAQTCGRDVVGVGIAPAEHRAKGVPGDVGLVFDGLEIGLGHLADLLVQGHRLEQLLGFGRRGRVVVLGFGRRGRAVEHAGQ